jgi:hypothetical protein
MSRKRFEHFTHFIFTNPSIVCLTTFILAFIFPIVLLCIFPLRLGNNPEKVKIIIIFLILFYFKGFETDGTFYSGSRLTWTNLQVILFFFNFV